MNKYSFVVPVYNRPQEVRELLESMVVLDFTEPFEVVIVEDGSTETSANVVSQFSDKLNISYYYKKNSGPGDSRNYGMARAKGNYFVILDSDCILPSNYLSSVDKFLSARFFHCFGGPDAAHTSFSPLQKAINYVMTSLLTTGGIRGNKKGIQKFEPRSFNMGISKEAFEATGGFGKIHPGEDPDLSQRILLAGYQTVFIPDSFVYHKRRISWNKFYLQVKKFGMVRPILNQWHPSSSKITFWFPSLFIFFVLLSLILGIYNWVFLIPLGVYILAIFVDSSINNRSLYIGFLSIPAVFIQFFGYGLAFIKSFFFVSVLNKDPQKQFPFLFFK
ncbi:glycosyltransferase [Aequorivita sp. H23M31]|uniref:Glycosyltransferase n=1 Tax=Aequorivita ciconiae TaxID=2494375 RepID=A0A410FZG1_9FLAO|nr:glycosyltransferase [Aequorivita sp. H23M31]QAA80396.1 glycosyltransferase [Aequorivita sp. H23M31]